MGVRNTFVKSFGLYFLGNILSKIIMFILLPVYTDYLPPEELGYYDVANTYLNLLVTFLFVDIYVGIMRFVFDQQGLDDSNRPVSNGIIIFCVSFVLYTLIAIIAGIFGEIRFLGYIYVYGVGLVLNNLFGYLARTMKLNQVFAISGVLGTLVTSLVSVVGLIYTKGDIEVLYIAAICGLFLQVGILEYNLHIFNYVSFKYYDKTLLKSLFLFSLPLSLNSLAYWFLTGYSNVIISAMLSLKENGIYMVAVKFGLIINLLPTCFNLAWQELIFRKGNEDRESLGIFYSKAMNLLVDFVGLGALILIHVSNLIFPYMVANSYESAKYIIPMCILAAIINVISGFMGQIYAALKATKIIVYSTFSACILNVVIVPFFVLRWGLLGATLAIVISYLVNVIMRIYLIRSVVCVHFDRNTLLFLSVMLTISLFVYYSGGTIGNILMVLFLVLIGIVRFKEQFYMLVKKAK